MLTHAKWIRRITLDRRPSALLAVLSAAYALYLVSGGNFAGIFFFISGAGIAYPPIFHMWADIENNWKGTYRNFFLGAMRTEARNRMIMDHWKKTWWVFPYLFFVYGYCAFIAISIGYAYAALLFSGSLFATGLVSYQAQSRLSTA